MSFVETFVKTYRGCDIYTRNQGTAAEPDWYYGSPCITGWYGTIAKVKEKIDALTEPPVVIEYTWELIEAYRGGAIYLLHPDETHYAIYEGVSYGPFSYTGAKTKINQLTGYVPLPLEYTCPTCGAVFSTEAELAQHIAAMHPVDPPPTIYTCPECGVTFTTLEELDRHVETMHPPEPPTEPPEDPSDEYITTWAGYEIWYRPVAKTFYIMVDGVATGEFRFIGEVTAYIENVLLEIPPYEPPPPIIPPDVVPGEEAEQLGNIGDLMGRYGTPGTLRKDSGMSAAIAKPINDFLTSLGLTPDALQGVLGSGADPEKAAQFAASISTASVGAVALLGTVGVLAEVASLGQIEGVLGTVDMVLDKTGIGNLMNSLFEIPFMAALVTPARHHWNSMFTPEISGLSQLTRELVREVITLDTYIAEAAMQGLSEERATRIYAAHWRELGIRDTDIILHRGGMTEEEWEKYRVIQDYRPDARPGFEFSDLEMSKVLRKTILGRVDTRRAYQYGMLERPDLIKMYTDQGYEDDAELQADIQILASVAGLQSAIRREEGMMYRDRLKDARKDESEAVGRILADRNTKLVDLGNATIAGEYTEEEAAVIEADIRKKADLAIFEVRPKARAREAEAEVLYRTALEEVKTNIDPEDLWVLRYKLAAARVEVAEEFEIVPPVDPPETPEEPE